MDIPFWRPGSEPPEDTHQKDMLSANSLVIRRSLDSRTKMTPGRTRQTKRYEISLRQTFIMKELSTTPPWTRPSLSDAGNRTMPPILSTTTFTADPFQPKSAVTGIDVLKKIRDRRLKKAKLARLAPKPKMTKSPSATFPASFQKSLPTINENEVLRSNPELTSIHSSAEASTGKDSDQKLAIGVDFSGPVPTADDEDMPDTDVESSPSPPPQRMPSISRPKREGYGFHYSEFSTTSQSTFDEGPSAGETIINPNTSFQDIVVMRNNTNFLQPSTLSCTAAKFEDTVRIKYAASKLLKFTESEKIYENLSNRLERMLHMELDKMDGKLKQGQRYPSVHACAIKLRDHIIKFQKERVEVGECERLVEHELKWAEWFVEASRVGVLHLKVMGCRCRPEWEQPIQDISG